MEIKFIIKILSKALILLFVVFLGFVFLFYNGTHPPKPKSDVPITYKIGCCPYQETITVSDLRVKVVSNLLGLFNSRAVLEYEENLGGQVLKNNIIAL